MTFSDIIDNLPGFNACCNLTSAGLLLLGWLAIRKMQIVRHKRLMISAFMVSALFLVGYLTRHAVAGSTKFTGTGAWRRVYFTILISHTFLAVINFPLVIVTLRAGLRNQIDRHRKLARVCLPMWFYVSVTGVVVYFMLYRF